MKIKGSHARHVSDSIDRTCDVINVHRPQLVALHDGQVYRVQNVGYIHQEDGRKIVTLNLEHVGESPWETA